MSFGRMYSNSFTVRVGKKSLRPMEDFCKEHCRGDWLLQGSLHHSEGFLYDGLFEFQDDATLFALKFV